MGLAWALGGLAFIYKLYTQITVHAQMYCRRVYNP